MSSSSETGRASQTITVKAPFGVEIMIRSGAFDEIARGFDRLELSLPHGIYTVRWECAGKISQQIIKLKDAPLALGYDESADRREAEAIATVVSLSNSRPKGSGLVIVVISPDDGGKTSLLRDFRVSSLNDKGRKAVEGTRWDAHQALVFDLAPGPYLLTYRNPERILIDQCVHVHPTRQTVVVMASARISQPERARNEVRFRTREGINLAATRIISLPSGAPMENLASRLRVTGCLLDRLARGYFGPDPRLWEQASQFADPYLRMYETSLSLGLSGDPNDDVDATPAIDLDAEPAEIPSGQVVDAWSSADTLCAMWQRSLNGSVSTDLGFSDLPAPPMLELSWDWATRWSSTNPGQRKLSAELVAASNARVNASPWLAWRSAAKRESGAHIIDTISHAEKVTRVFSEVLTSLAAPTTSKRSIRGKAFEVPSFDMSLLSPSTRQLASTLLTKMADAPDGGPSRLVNDMISYLKAPPAEVAQQIEKAMLEVTAASGSVERVLDDVFTSDPHKGRFGGRTEAEGIKVELVDWGSSNDPEYLSLKIGITAPDSAPKPTGPVRLHLHPTFNPSLELVAWKGRKAKFRCYAMGGFTLGVETMINGIRLELDLALDERLPDWFRER
ncbi:hypothetical protein [Pararhizobium sp. PWRC1-1]|uniref:hypothetical protein n=1 Tax=Pararhizobium sp. PWRC1-1 TaxID=2804566 RepID=UPI003CE91E8E